MPPSIRWQAYIRAILAWGVDQQLIRFNPWRDYKRLPAKKMEITATLDDFQHILKFCPGWLRWALATAYALAMRPGPCRTIQPDMGRVQLASWLCAICAGERRGALKESSPRLCTGWKLSADLQRTARLVFRGYVIGWDGR